MIENSFFLSAFLSGIEFLKRQYDTSILRKIMLSWGSFFSRTWKNSKIEQFLMNGFVMEKSFNHSVFEKMNQGNIFKHTSALWEKADPAHSIFGYLKIFCDSLLHLPLASFAMLFISMGVTMLAADFLMFKSMTILSTGVLLVGFLMLLFYKTTISSLVNGSVLLSFFLRFFRLSDAPLKEEKASQKYQLFMIILGLMAGGTSFFLPNMYAILGLFALGGMVLVFYAIEIGIFALVFLLPLVPTKICLGLSLLIVLSFFGKLLTGKIKLSIAPMDVFVILYGVVLLYSTALSFIPQESLVVALVYLLFIFVYFAVKHTIKDKEKLYTLVGLFVSSSMLLALYGIYQKLTGSFIVTASWLDTEVFQGMSGRIYSSLDNPNVLGEYLIFSMIVSFGLLYANKKISYKLFGLGSLLVCGLCMIFTLSRGAWLGLIFAVAIFALIHDRRLIVLGLLILPFLPFLLPPSIIERFTSIGDMSDGSTSYRVGIWLASIQLIKSFWPVGIGLSEAVFLYIYQKFAFNAVFASHSHNLYMQWVIDYGMVGFIILLGIIIFVVKLCIQSREKTPDAYNKSIIAAFLAGMMGYLLQGMTDNVWYNYRIVLFFWVVCGLIHGIASQILYGNKLSEGVKDA